MARSIIRSCSKSRLFLRSLPRSIFPSRIKTSGSPSSGLRSLGRWRVIFSKVTDNNVQTASVKISISTECSFSYIVSPTRSPRITAEMKSKGVRAEISFLPSRRVIAHSPIKPAINLIVICPYSMRQPLQSVFVIYEMFNP
ncbi:hypothetical protein D3C79_870110 [compost metagenome]